MKFEKIQGWLNIIGKRFKREARECFRTTQHDERLLIKDAISGSKKDLFIFNYNSMLSVFNLSKKKLF